MNLIAIQDANILIDLVKTGLFDYCLALPYRFVTTNLILDELYEEQVTQIQPHINSGKFEIIVIDELAMLAIQIAAQEDTRLSEQDWSAFYYASQMNAFLLTGDKRLRNLAKSKNIIVCGIFWVLDELVKATHISNPEACGFLKALELNNKRLPAEEVHQRVKLWCGK